MLAAVAEFERELILSRTTTGRAAKAAQGGFAYGAPPFGWAVIDGELEQIAEEQRVIQLIEKYKSLNWSLRDIAAKLTEQGYKTKRGGAWHPSILAKILGRFKK
jgi:DNA invertase Pin-like site-specific DNA recombinase